MLSARSLSPVLVRDRQRSRGTAADPSPRRPVRADTPAQPTARRPATERLRPPAALRGARRGVRTKHRARGRHLQRGRPGRFSPECAEASAMPLGRRCRNPVLPQRGQKARGIEPAGLRGRSNLFAAG